MGKVMVFGNNTGAEWYSRGGCVTVRSRFEIKQGLPERQALMSHRQLHLRSTIHLRSYEMSNLRFRIKEVHTKDGNVTYYPQYRRYTWWRYIYVDTLLETYKASSNSKETAEAYCRDMQRRKDSKVVTGTTYKDLP